MFYSLSETIVCGVKCGCQDGSVSLGLGFGRVVQEGMYICPCFDGCFFQNVDKVQSVDEVGNHLFHVFAKVSTVAADPSDSKDLAA